MYESLIPFFKPLGVAVIGASSSPQKLSYGIMKNLTSQGFTGQIAPVNPNETEVLGKKAYASILDVPDPVDLGVIVLPAKLVTQTLEDCGKRGLKAVVIITGGFKEIGADGANAEANLVEIARRYNMRLIGPNCVGTLDMYTGANTTFINGLPAKGSIGFISQSGAVAGGVVDLIREKGIGFSNFSSLGNEADVTETDVIDYLAHDPDTKVIAAYVEQIKDGRRFIEVSKAVTPFKPIVMLKVGQSSAGARAVSSHTGSLAGSHAAYQAAFKQGGVLEARTVSELFDFSMAFAHQPLPKGPRAVILTNAGGPAALLSDSLSANGLQMADLTEETKSKLRACLLPAAQVANPVDMLGAASPEEYEQASRIILADPGVDILLPVLVPQVLVSTVGVAQGIINASKDHDKTVLMCMMGDYSIDAARLLMHENHIPLYTHPETPGNVLGAMLRYREILDRKPAAPEKIAHINSAAATDVLAHNLLTESMGERWTRPLLAAYGIPIVPGDFAASADEAAAIADRVGYPVVLKIVSPQLLHKSEIGGIVLNLKDAAAVRDAYKNMMDQIAAKMPDAFLEGALVEAMAPKGHEVIIGMRREPGFGPLMMFGFGGIFVELFGDVAFRVAPLTRQDAYDMIAETKAGRVLKGLRGGAPADIDAVADTILRLSQICLDYPRISEIEINPLLVFEKGKGVLALDGRAIL